MEYPDLDPELLDRLCKDDIEAQGIFWRRFHAYLLAQVRSQGVWSDRDVEDIVSTVFLKVFSSIKSFRQVSRFTTWLYAVSRNAILDYYRLPKYRPIPNDVPISQIIEEWTPSDGNFRKGSASPWSEGEPKRPLVLPDNTEINRQIITEAVQRIYAATLKLNPAYREVVICRLFLANSVRETAKLLGRSESSVMSTFSRALDSLAEILRKDTYFSAEQRGGEKLEEQVF